MRLTEQCHSCLSPTTGWFKSDGREPWRPYCLACARRDAEQGSRFARPHGPIGPIYDVWEWWDGVTFVGMEEGWRRDGTFDSRDRWPGEEVTAGA